MKLNRQYRIGVIGVAVIIIIVAGVLAMSQKKTKSVSTSKTTTKVVKHQPTNPYQNLSNQKAQQVKAADQSVAKAINDKLSRVKNSTDKPTEAKVNKAAATATAKVSAIAGEDMDTKNIRKAYNDVITVTKDPSLDNVQTARTAINNLKDDTLKKHIVKTSQQKMIGVAAEANHVSVADVTTKTKPLSAAQVKAKETSSKNQSAAASSAAVAQSQATSSSQTQASSQAQPQTQQPQNNTQQSTQSSSTYTANQGGQASSQYSQPSQNTATNNNTYHSSANNQATANTSHSTYTPPKQTTPTPKPKPSTPAANNNAQSAASTNPYQSAADVLLGHNQDGSQVFNW